MRYKVYKDEQVRVDKLQMCFTKVNDRGYVCKTPYNIFVNESSANNTVWVVYNPQLQVQELVTLILPSSAVMISKWVTTERKFQQLYSEAHCYEGPDLAEECEVVVQVDAAPLASTLLLIQQDPMGVTNVTEAKGFSLSSEVKKADLEITKARMVNSTLVDPYYIRDKKDCNTSYAINNTRISASLLSCNDGKLRLNVTQAGFTKEVEVELRGYEVLSPEDAERQGPAGIYVSGIGSRDSVPLNLSISHLGLAKSEHLH